VGEKAVSSLIGGVFGPRPKIPGDRLGASIPSFGTVISGDTRCNLHSRLSSSGEPPKSSHGSAVYQ
jgi:hypothetical protein